MHDDNGGGWVSFDAFCLTVWCRHHYIGVDIACSPYLDLDGHFLPCILELHEALSPLLEDSLTKFTLTQEDSGMIFAEIAHLQAKATIFRFNWRFTQSTRV